MRDASVRLYHITELVSWLSLVERVFFAPKCEPYRSAWGNASILLLAARWKVGSARSIPMFRASFAAAPCRRQVRATRTARSADSYSICMAAMPLRRTHSAAWACILCHHVYRIRRSCLSTLMHLHVHVLCLLLALYLDSQRLSFPISSQGGCLALLGSPDEETRLYWREVSLTLSCQEGGG